MANGLQANFFKDSLELLSNHCVKYLSQTLYVESVVSLVAQLPNLQSILHMREATT